MRCVFRSHYRDYKLNQPKIEDSEGMCGSESGYDNCWGRFCRPERNQVLRDVLRGLLVLIVLAIVVTVIFLLCYFLLNDIEKKEEKIVDDLIKDFSSAEPNKPLPEFSSSDGKTFSPNDAEAYDSGPNRGRGDLDPADESPKKSDSNQEESISFPPGSFVPVGFQKDSKTGGKLLEDISLPEGKENILGSETIKEDFESDPFEIITDFVEATSGTQCVPLRLPLCSGSMPWGLSSFPNWVGNNNAQELQESFKYFQSTIVGSRCSVKASEYSCAILEPACGPDGVPLPPCRSFCEDIVKTCSEFLVSGHQHNSAFECAQFPDSKNPNICVDISRETTTSISDSFHKSHKSHSEVATKLNPFEQENDAFATENPVEDIVPWIEKPSKRPSLADILSGSAHVSVPSSFHLSTSPSSVITKQFRFSSTKGPETRGKAFDSSPKPHRNSFSSFGPFPFTSKPKEEEENNSKTSPRLSLAALLSSTSMATPKPQLQSQNPFDYPDETESPFDERAAESVDYPTFTATKSLSDLLSSSLPSFATSSARREHKECAELRCLDGTCLSLTQLNDGVKDCPDGSDEQKLNNISLK